MILYYNIMSSKTKNMTNQSRHVGGAQQYKNPATTIFDNSNSNSNNNFSPGNRVILINGNVDGYNNGIIVETNQDNTYEVEMQYPNDEGVITLRASQIRLDNTGTGNNKSRKRRRRKRTRKNKRKYRKSKSKGKRLPKLTRRTPYKKYS